jgi:hypothetical protein
MLDGLDEVPEVQREKVSRWINGNAELYQRVYLISRPHGYDSSLFEGVQPVQIQPFNREFYPQTLVGLQLSWLASHSGWGNSIV